MLTTDVSGEASVLVINQQGYVQGGRSKEVSKPQIHNNRCFRGSLKLTNKSNEKVGHWKSQNNDWRMSREYRYLNSQLKWYVRGGQKTPNAQNHGM